jgi:syntaxin-binding protein 1
MSHIICYVTYAITEGIRRVVRERVLGEMLGNVSDSTGGGWKVLIMDAFTTKITSAAVRMSDILDAGKSPTGCILLC